MPDQPRALHILAIAAVRQGYPGEAVELLRRAVRADPHFAVAFNDLGYLLAQQGMLSEAAQSYRHAIAEAPAFAGAHNNLGHVLEMAGSFEEAVACYRNAISLRPGNADVFRNLSSAFAGSAAWTRRSLRSGRRWRSSRNSPTRSPNWRTS